MGASFLVGHTGIEQVILTNNAAYLAGSRLSKATPSL
jgi:hypothetical protein